MRTMLVNLGRVGAVLLLATAWADCTFAQYQDTGSEAARGYSSNRVQANISEQGSGYGLYGPYGPYPYGSYFTRSVIPKPQPTPSGVESRPPDGRPDLGFPLSSDLYLRNWYRGKSARRSHTDLGATWSEGEGRLVAREVAAESELGRAGLRAGDEIVSIDGRNVRSQSEWRQAVDAIPARHEVQIVVRRDGNVETLHWTPSAGGDNELPAGSAPAGEAGSKPIHFITAARLRRGSQGHARLGVQLDDRFADAAVVRSVQHGSAAEVAGLRPGDVILSVSGRDIASSQDLIQALSRIRPDSTVELFVRRSPVDSAPVPETINDHDSRPEGGAEPQLDLPAVK